MKTFSRAVTRTSVIKRLKAEVAEYKKMEQLNDLAMRFFKQGLKAGQAMALKKDDDGQSTQTPDNPVD